MTMVTMTAIRQLYGDWGMKGPGEQFVTDSKTAEKLEQKGLAERYYEVAVARPKTKVIEPETKVVEPEPPASAVIEKAREPRRYTLGKK
jgi:hypothetical protein